MKVLSKGYKRKRKKMNGGKGEGGTRKGRIPENGNLAGRGG